MKIPEGWPTEEMLFAAREACDDMFQTDFIRAFKAALAAAPTLPAPARKSETDDLYGYVDEFNHLWSVDEARPELEDGNHIGLRPVYTRSANDGLRKAAERVIHCWLRENWTDGMPDLSTCLKWLNDALEGK